jgi:cobalt/nickel transport system ATP-binding protein
MPTVLEDVMFGPRSQGLDYQRAQARALQALAALGAEHLAHRPPHHLSLGEKRRVAMAGILAMQPELIALDEPLAGLDPRGRAQLAHLLDQVPVTQIIATHDIAFARRWCATALILKAGRQLAWGSAAELLSDEELLRAAELNEE